MGSVRRFDATAIPDSPTIVTKVKKCSDVLSVVRLRSERVKKISPQCFEVLVQKERSISPLTVIEQK